jgi:hypothetical protein
MNMTRTEVELILVELSLYMYGMGVCAIAIRLCALAFARTGKARMQGIASVIESKLIGAPLALYWPVWLMFNRTPTCYWRGNCS